VAECFYYKAGRTFFGKNSAKKLRPACQGGTIMMFF